MLKPYLDLFLREKKLAFNKTFDFFINWTNAGTVHGKLKILTRKFLFYNKGGTRI